MQTRWLSFIFAQRGHLTIPGADSFQCALRRDYVEGTHTSPVGYLEGVFVQEEYRGRGVATALLRACEAWAGEKGCAEFAVGWTTPQAPCFICAQALPRRGASSASQSGCEERGE